MLKIPKSYAEQLLLTNGSKVQLLIENNGLVVKPIHEEGTLTLEYLMEGMTAENRHEDSFSDLQGDEKWEY